VLLFLPVFHSITRQSCHSSRWCPTPTLITSSGSVVLRYLHFELEEDEHGSCGGRESCFPTGFFGKSIIKGDIKAHHLFYKARFIQKMVSFYIALYDALPKETSWKTAFLENPLEFTLSEATASL